MALAGPHAEVDAGARSGHAEGVAVAVDHERGYPGVQLVRPGPVRPAGRMQRERQCHHAGRAERAGGPAGDPGAAGAAAEYQVRGFGAQCGDDGGPGLVELAGRGRCPAPAHPVRLGDAGDRDRGGEHRRTNRQQVRRVHPAPGTMAENEQAARRTCGRRDA